MDFMERRGDEPLLVKNTRNSFTSTDLQQRLDKLGIRRLVVTGIQMEQCVETTTRLAADLGYEVDFALDATQTFPIVNRATGEEISTDALVERTQYVLRDRCPDRQRARPRRGIGRRGPIDRVIFLVLPTVEILDLAGPLQAFAEANAVSPRYAIQTVSTHTVAESAQGVTLSQLEPLAPATEGSLVVVPGIKYAATERADRRVVRWLRDAYETGATIASTALHDALESHP
jgi:hypothetical protein